MMSGSGLKEGAKAAGGAEGAVSTGGDGDTGTGAAGRGALPHAASTTATNGTDRRMLEAGREETRMVARD